MSHYLQDESFPADEFVDELNFSSGGRFQFPRRHHRMLEQQHRQQQCEEQQPANALMSTNTSSSSSSDQQNWSSESNTGRPPSDLSAKTTESDPTGLPENALKKLHFNKHEEHNKAFSFQDVHSEYTKRRYKHVESKVGQYIANLKFETRRDAMNVKFQRHRSLPETSQAAATLTAMPASASTSSVAQRHSSADDLCSMTHAASSGSASASASASASGGEAEELDLSTSDAYAQLCSEKERIERHNDLLQTRLDEAVGQNIALKRQLDLIQYEQRNYKDKQRRQHLQCSLSGLGGELYGGCDGGGGAVGDGINLLSMAHHSSPSLCWYQSARCTKATQTILKSPLPGTPPDANNNSNTFESLDAALVGVGVGIGRATGAAGENHRRSITALQPLAHALNFSTSSGEQDSSGDAPPCQRRVKLSRRLLQLFRGCCRCCTESNALSEADVSSQQHTQVPLLEKSSTNHCRHMR